MHNTWYIIANPTSGNGIVKKKWTKITSSLERHKLTYEITFSKYRFHEKELVHNAIKKGYRKFIAIGGDGTLHQIVNGVMTQKFIDPLKLKIGILPMGTGNDWVKTHKIPKRIDTAISILKKGNSIVQDIGKLELLDTKETIYFNNLAGLGFDGFVVKNLLKYKKYGAFSYMLATIASFLKYKQRSLIIEFNNKLINTQTLLTLVGICQYSGGGMKLTKNVDVTDGLFDISIAKNFNFIGVILNIIKFYNGTITQHKEVETYKTAVIKITTTNEDTYIQADGELVGKGGFKASIIPKALAFVVP